MLSVDQLLAQVAQLQATLYLQAQTIATLTAMLSGDEPTPQTEPDAAYLNSRGGQ